MTDPTIARLRTLLEEITSQAATLTADLMPYLHTNNLTFRRRPDLPSDPTKISVTTTCTCLMALAMSNKLPALYGDTFKQKTQACFDLITKAPWKSSGLGRDNAFTTAIVLRALGFLVEAGILDRTYATVHGHLDARGETQYFATLAQRLADKAPNSFRIEKHRLPSATVAYWFVDGVHRSQIHISTRGWKKVFSWADATLTRQVANVKANDEKMDPVEMAMAACLWARLRTMASRSQSGAAPELLLGLDSHNFFQEALELLFIHQTQSGLWHKYFELFSYRDERGSNYCFTFEMLEALLHEFGSSHLDLRGTTYEHLDLPLQWCKHHDKTHVRDDVAYRGWNSAGQPVPLANDIPESWATAVVHMFVQELYEQATRQLQRLHLTKYGARIEQQESTPWNKLLAMPIRLAGGAFNTIQDVLAKEVALPAQSRTPSSIRRAPLKSPHFVLLFGPPGTGKTQLVRAFARHIGWPLIEVNPSHFLTPGLDNIFDTTNEVFLDLSDLAATVIFFDEFDGFVRERQDDELDTISRMLTTAMLPKLSDLRAKGHVIFFAATNHRGQADSAITRFGRFDLQICMSPPTWQEKVAHLNTFVDEDLTKHLNTVIVKLSELSARISDDQREILDFLTVGEARAFFRTLTNPGQTFAESVERLSLPIFAGRIEESSKQMLIAAGGDLYNEFIRDRDMSKLG